MSHGWLNVRFGRYFVQAWGYHVRVQRMDDAWVARFGNSGWKVFIFFGYHG